jgi:hypothetical protein
VFVPPTDRLAFETEAINRALQHDLVLFGNFIADDRLFFCWRAKGGRRFGPPFDDRRLAIDWMAKWLADDSSAGGLAR